MKIRMKYIFGVLVAAVLVLGGVTYATQTLHPTVQCPGFGCGPPPPALDWNFARDKALDSRLTFTRASDGTYFDSAGVLQTATTNEARFDHDPALLTSLGLLIEEQRTNLALQSEDLGTTWNNFFTTETTDQAVAPDGNTTADEFIHTSAGGSILQNITVAADTEHTSSAYFQANGGTWLLLSYRESDSSNATNTWFNISTGAIGTGTGTIQDVGGSWYRASVSGTIGALATNGRILISNVTADSSFTVDQVNSAFVWGIQLEPGAFPTSYIKTTTASTTRSADVVSTTDVSWFNQSAGMLFIEWDTAGAGGSELLTPWAISDGTVNNRYQQFVNGSTLTNRLRDGGTNYDPGTLGAVSAGVAVKSAMSWEIGSAAAVKNGGTPTTSSPAGLPTVTKFTVGDDFQGGTRVNGHIAEIKYWNVRKPNTFLQDRTASATNDNEPTSMFAANDNGEAPWLDAVGW